MRETVKPIDNSNTYLTTTLKLMWFYNQSQVLINSKDAEWVMMICYTNRWLV